MIKHISIITLFSLFTFAASANAFTITSQLTGDPRTANPDNLFVDVTINVTTPNFASWAVDINSPSHSGIKLDAFYFNLSATNTELATITFSNFNPNGWSIITPASNASGSGSADFIFAADNCNGQGCTDVTNTVSLTFDMTTTFTLLESTFLGALDAVSNNTVLGEGQMGAHLQSLVAGAGESDSGFAFGDYEVEGGGGGQTVVPEPSTMILLGVGLVGLAVYRRKQN